MQVIPYRRRDTPKRKRRGVYKRTFKKRRFIRGRDRVGGYYGRFSKRDGELKFHDVDLDDAVVSGGGTVTATINIIPQGTTEVERIGRKCNIRKIAWRYSLSLPAAAGATLVSGDILRMILFIDKQANGATAAVTDVLESAHYQSFNNLSNSGRFRILMDKTYDLNNTAGAGDGAVNDSPLWEISDSFYKDCNIPIEFSSTTGAITEIRSNNLGVLLISRGGSPKLDSKFRLRFSDN